MNIKEVMAQPTLVVTETTTLEEVTRFMLEHRIGCVPLVNSKGKLSGIITESSLLRRKRVFPFRPFVRHR